MISPPPITQMFLPGCLRRRGKGPDRLRDELDAGRHGRGSRPAREHIMHIMYLKVRAHLRAQVEGLATENLGVDRARKFR